MTLSSNSFSALMQGESKRLRRRIEIRQNRRQRSQYAGTITSYDADRGEAIISIPQGGVIYAESITASSSLKVGVSLPQLDTRAKADAKPPTT